MYGQGTDASRQDSPAFTFGVTEGINTGDTSVPANSVIVLWYAYGEWVTLQWVIRLLRISFGVCNYYAAIALP